MGGVVHTHGSTSVIVLVVHQLDIPSHELKRDPPVAAHPHRPHAFALALECVEVTGAARLHRAAPGGMMGSATLLLRVPFFAPETFRDER